MVMGHSLRVVVIGSFLCSIACTFPLDGARSRDDGSCNPSSGSDDGWDSYDASSSSYDAGSRPTPSNTCALGAIRCAEGQSYYERCVDTNGGGRIWVPSTPCNSATLTRTVAVCRAGACTAPPDPCSSLRIRGPSLVQVGAYYGGPATYEAWAKLDPTSADAGVPDGGNGDGGDDGGAGGVDEAIVFGQGGADAGDEGWVVSCAGGKLVVDVFAATGPDRLIAETSCDDGAFHHVAVTFGAGTRVFFDGEPVAQTTSLPARRTVPFHIGSYPSRRVNGTTTLDEVVVSGSVRFTGAFDPKTIPTPTSGWFGLFFDEGKGTRTATFHLSTATYATVDESMWSATCR